MSEFDFHLRQARASIESHGPRPIFQLPWERGIWRQVFNPHPSPLTSISQSLPLPSTFTPQADECIPFSTSFAVDTSSNFDTVPSDPAPVHPDQDALEEPDDGHSIFVESILNRPSAQQSRLEGLRHLAISRLISLIAVSDGSSMFLSASDPWDLHDSFQAALSMKATSTIIKRSLDLQRFHRWCVAHEQIFLPFSEKSLWSFLRELQHTAKPSGPQSILQAVNFAIHVLGCQVHGPPLSSVRIRGLCSGHKALALNINHAPPLSVAQIVQLETLCCSSSSPYLKLVFGSILIALYARSRWKDIQGASSIDFDPNEFAPQYIELPSQHFKTSAMLAKKLHFLPITAIAFSISGQPWMHHYIQSRRDLSLTTAGKLTIPFLPDRLHDNLCTEAVSSSTITKILREVLHAPSLRSHSLKHTLLSFAAKRGFDPHIRKLLGYHLDRQEVTLATYSRDLLAEPLRQLKSMLHEIQAGIFKPDSTRSGYLSSSTALPILESTTSTAETSENPQITTSDHAELPEEHHEKVVNDDDSSSSSSGSSSSSLSDDSDVENVPSFPAELAEHCFSHVQRFIPVKHRLTHRLHLMKDPTQPRLICGRALSQTYERLSDFPQHPLPTCVHCFASKLVGSFDEA